MEVVTDTVLSKTIHSEREMLRVATAGGSSYGQFHRTEHRIYSYLGLEGWEMRAPKQKAWIPILPDNYVSAPPHCTYIEP